MELKTTLVAALLAFGVSAGVAAVVSRTDLRDGPSAPAVDPSRPRVAATGYTYAALLDDNDKRIDSLSKRAGKRPDDWLIRQNLGVALLDRASLSNRIDDFSRVQTTLDEAFAIVDEGSGPLLLAARFNFSLHRLAAAESYLDKVARKAVPRQDEQMAAQVLRAEIAVQRGQYAEAFAGLSAVAAAAPVLANAELGLYHAKTGDPDKAAALLEQALAATIAKDPRRRAWLRLQLGILAMNRGDLRAATGHLQDADAELAGWWLVREHIAEIHSRRAEHDEALAIVEAIVRETDLPQHMDAVASLYRHKGENDKAEPWIAQAAARWDQQLAVFPESAMGHALQHHLQFGTPERALELALANVALRPGGDAQVLLARAYMKASQPAEALAVAERVLATPYRTAGLHDVAAKAHAALGHAAAADEQISLCYAINPQFSSDDHTH